MKAVTDALLHDNDRFEIQENASEYGSVHHGMTDTDSVLQTGRDIKIITNTDINALLIFAKLNLGMYKLVYKKYKTL